MKDEIRIQTGGGNVFADLGIDNPEEYQAKADLAARIIAIVRERGLTQEQTAALLSVEQPTLARMLRGRLDGFSTARLMHYLTLLGCDIQIRVSQPQAGTRGLVRVAEG